MAMRKKPSRFSAVYPCGRAGASRREPRTGRFLPPCCRNLQADTKGGGIKAANELPGRDHAMTHPRVALLTAALLIGTGTAAYAQMIVGPAGGPGPGGPPPGTQGKDGGAGRPGPDARPRHGARTLGRDAAVHAAVPAA